MTPVGWVAQADGCGIEEVRPSHGDQAGSSVEELTLDMALRDQGGGMDGPLGGNFPEQALVDLLSAHLPPGHPDTDVSVPTVSWRLHCSYLCAVTWRSFSAHTKTWQAIVLFTGYPALLVCLSASRQVV